MNRISALLLVLFLAFTAAIFPSALQSQRKLAGTEPPPALDSAQLISRLARLADSLERSHALSGVILLARNGVAVFEHAYGLADRERNRANSVGTAFNLSSIGKRFTQVAVAQLVASGRLSLDSTIASVWPDYPNSDAAHRVTIRELLNHTSGIGGDVFKNPESSRSNHDYLKLFVNEPLHFAPGTREEYSNAGYIVLGEVIARVSHEDYYAYVNEHVFAPAGMTSAGFFARDSLPGFVANGYTQQPHDGSVRNEHAALERSDAQHPRRGSAAGGSYASASDLLRFLRAFRDGRLGAPADSKRALIAGGSPGSNGVIAEGLPGGYDLIVLENLDPPAADAVVAPVLSWLGAKPPEGARVIRADGGSREVPGRETTLPNTPAGSIAAEYLRAYNTGDTATMARFFDDKAVSDPTRPTSARVETYAQIYAENGRLTVISIDEVKPLSLRLSARGATGGTLSMTFSVDDTAPAKLKSLRVDLSR